MFKQKKETLRFNIRRLLNEESSKDYHFIWNGEKKKKKNPKPPSSHPIKKNPFAPRLLPEATLLDSRNARTRTQLLPFTPILSTLRFPCVKRARVCTAPYTLRTHVPNRNANLAFVAAHVRVRTQRASREVVDGALHVVGMATTWQGGGYTSRNGRVEAMEESGERRECWWAEGERVGGNGGKVVGEESGRVGREQSVN